MSLETVVHVLYAAFAGTCVGLAVMFWRIRRVNREVDQKRRDILVAIERIERKTGQAPGEAE